MLTVEDVLAEYDSLRDVGHSKRLRSSEISCYPVLSSRAGTACAPSSSYSKRLHRLGPASTNDIIFQYVILSTSAPGIGAAKMEGRAAGGSTGGAPGLWNWCAGVACGLEDVNATLYRGQLQQIELLVVRTAILRGVRDWANVQLTQLRSLVRRSHQPKSYDQRMGAAKKLRDEAGATIGRITERKNYDREVVIAMNSFELRRVRPLVL